MSILNEPQGAAAAATAAAAPPVRVRKPGSAVVDWLTTTDHKKIGTLYLVTSFFFFCVGGVLALVMRAELARPGTQLVSNEQFNQAFTMHGTIMLLMFATPLFAGFANWIMPLQIGSPDVAFPRLNMFAYWLYLFGSLIAVAGFLTRRAPRTSAGSPTPRCPTPSARRVSAATCGSWAWPSPASARSSVRSTSSPRSSACALPA